MCDWDDEVSEVSEALGTLEDLNLPVGKALRALLMAGGAPFTAILELLQAQLGSPIPMEMSASQLETPEGRLAFLGLCISEVQAQRIIGSHGLSPAATVTPRPGMLATDAATDAGLRGVLSGLCATYRIPQPSRSESHIFTLERICVATAERTPIVSSEAAQVFHDAPAAEVPTQKKPCAMSTAVVPDSEMPIAARDSSTFLLDRSSFSPLQLALLEQINEALAQECTPFLLQPIHIFTHLLSPYHGLFPQRSTSCT